MLPKAFALTDFRLSPSTSSVTMATIIQSQRSLPPFLCLHRLSSPALLQWTMTDGGVLLPSCLAEGSRKCLPWEVAMTVERNISCRGIRVEGNGRFQLLFLSGWILHYPAGLRRFGEKLSLWWSFGVTRARAAIWRVGDFSASLTSVTADYKGIGYHDDRLTMTPFSPEYNANRTRPMQAQKHFGFSEVKTLFCDDLHVSAFCTM